MFTYFPKLFMSDATPAGDQSLSGVLQINMVSLVEINGPYFLAHLSRRLRGELIVYRSSRRPSVRASVRVSTLSNMNISETNGSIATKFDLKHHLGGRLAALGFGPDQIRTLVSMATESSHRVIIVKTVSPLFLCCLSSDPFHTCR